MAKNTLGKGLISKLLNCTDMKHKPTHECKNCSSASVGQYCSFCGQRYHAHKESFGELVYEFASDFTHFDSRFFKTLLPILFSPGTLTKSYNDGKQRSQFHPIRLYLFGSFLYFLLLFAFGNLENNIGLSDNTNPVADFSATNSGIKILPDSIDLATGNSTKALTNGGLSADSNVTETHQAANKNNTNTDQKLALHFSGRPYLDSLMAKNVTPQQYLDQQNSFSESRKAGYFERIFTLRLLKINLEGKKGQAEFVQKLSSTFLHNIPKMLFLLLPVFALLLKLLYVRRKQFYFVDHAILSLHYFSFIFLLLILSLFILDKIFNTAFFVQVSVPWIFLYLLLAMKKLYGQTWGKTLLKFFALVFLFTFAVIVTMFINFAWSAFMM